MPVVGCATLGKGTSPTLCAYPEIPVERPSGSLLRSQAQLLHVSGGVPKDPLCAPTTCDSDFVQACPVGPTEVRRPSPTEVGPTVGVDRLMARLVGEVCDKRSVYVLLAGYTQE